jgi:hypothetical protein
MPIAPPWFNIRFKAGLLRNKVGKRDFIGLDPKTIEGVYVIQGKRRATETEIAFLCAGKPVEIEAGYS